MEVTQDQMKKQPFKWSTMLFTAGAAWGAASYGYSASIIGTTLGQPSFLIYMGLDTNPNASALIGAMNAMFYVGGIFGTISSGWLSDRYGRKAVIMGAAALIFVANALSAGSVNIGMFIVFRTLAGAGSFAEVTIVPLWINEIAPPRIRGVLAAINGVFVDVGYVSASYVGVGFYFAEQNPLGRIIWRGPLAIGCVPCILCILCTWFVPESPRYFLLQDQADKAWEVVKSLHSRDDDPDHTFATAEFYQMRRQLEFERTLNVSYMEFFRRPSYRKRALMSCGLTFCCIASGSLVINNYGTILYKGLGFGTTQTLLFQAGWLGTAFGTSLIGLFIVDRLPRPVFMGLGFLGCGITMTIQTALTANFIGSTNRPALASTVAMLFIWVACYSIFLEGPSFFYSGELYPTHLRAKGMTLGMVSLCVSSIIWLQSAPTAFKTIGWKFYLFFIIITFLAAGTILWKFPDTRNKPLEEIAKLFGDDDLVMIYQNEIVIDPQNQEVVVDEKDRSSTHIENTPVA